MPELSDFEVGQNVEIGDGQVGVVQFAGNTHFAPGDWVGVVFDAPIGKNDGSVQGQKYFDCPAGHGMFVRPSVATLLGGSTDKSMTRSTLKTNGAAVRGKSSNINGATSRRSLLDSSAPKRQSMNASSPTPGARISRLAGSGKSPTKQLNSNASSVSSTPRTNTPTSTVRKSLAPATAPRNRTSMGPPPSVTSIKRQPRASVAGHVKAPASTGVQPASTSRGTTSRLSIHDEEEGRLRSASRESKISLRSGAGSLAGSLQDDPLSPPDSETSARNLDRAQPTSLPPQELNLNKDISVEPSDYQSRSLGLAQRGVSSANALKRENEDLTTKLRIIEKKRLEDRDKLKNLDKTQADRDRFEGIIQKLQAKYQPQQQEMSDLRRQLNEAEGKVEELEGQLAENDTLNEMATLDKEMAEEVAETAKLELQTLRHKCEELELEVEVLREENGELGKEISPEEKTSQGWLQLERSNERYREALLRLRDMTQQQESDLRVEIADLEQEVSDYNKIKDEFASTKQGLSQSNAMIEDLRQQLDTALGAEEMIEDLTQRNLTLSEQIDDLKVNIEELESLKELNDELEINHTETEQQLQEEIGYQEALLMDEAKKAAMQDGTIQELEYTVSRFKELVTSMRNDLEDMKAAQQISESQAIDLSARSRAIEDLNLKLQSSAAKAQVKAIDLELGKLQAQESAEHLSIVQLFLPESFKIENDGVQALLRFKRLEFKAKMLRDSIRELAHDTSATAREDVFNLCRIIDRLTWISSTSSRFINNLQTCDLEAFKRLGAASFDLERTERAIDNWVNRFKKNDLNVGQFEADLTSNISLMKHLSEVHIGDNIEHHADTVLHQASMIQSELETTAIVLSQIKALSETKLDDSESEAMEVEDVQAVLDRLHTALSQTRSAKVVSTKIIRQVEDLKSRHLSLEQSTHSTVEQAQQSTEDLALVAFTLGEKIQELINRSAPKLISVSDFADAVQSIQNSPSSFFSKAHAVSSHLHAFYNLTTNLSQAVEFTSSSASPPWKILAQNMHAATADLNTCQAEIGHLKDEISGKNTTLAIKEKATEELSVKVEVLERRIGESGGQRERVRELETRLETTKSKEKDFIKKLGHLRDEYQALEAERDKLKRSAQAVTTKEQNGQTPAATVTAITSAISLQKIEALQAEIQILQSSIRYLRHAAHARKLSESMSFLSRPLPATKPLTSTTQNEAQDVLKEMLIHITHDDTQLVSLKSRPRSDRLLWRPVRETASWQVQNQKEEWEEWREWRNDVASRVSRSRNFQQQEVLPETGSRNAGRTPLAQIQLQVSKKQNVAGGIMITNPEDWEDAEQALGIKTL